MKSGSEKLKQWIGQGRDPRSAHWQIGLEALIEVFSPFLEPGRLVPAIALKEADIPVFTELQAVVDISPHVQAVFLPPQVAGKIRPPDSAPELQRIAEDQPAYKILLQKPGSQERIACIEISPKAHNPGVDLFQSGALLGTYDFEDRQKCIDSLAQILFAHMWEKDKWGQNDYRRYTAHWFVRVLDTGSGAVAVQADFSYFHTPSLIKSNPVDVIFTLIADMVDRRLQDVHGPIRQSLTDIYDLDDKEAQQTRFYEMAEKIVLQFLSVIKDLELKDFAGFSKKQTNDFKQATAGTIRKIVNQLESAGQG